MGMFGVGTFGVDVVDTDIVGAVSVRYGEWLGSLCSARVRLVMVVVAMSVFVGRCVSGKRVWRERNFLWWLFLAYVVFIKLTL